MYTWPRECKLLDNNAGLAEKLKDNLNYLQKLLQNRNLTIKQIKKKFEEQGCRFLGFCLELMKIITGRAFLIKRLNEIKTICSSTMDGYIDNSIEMMKKLGGKKVAISLFNLGLTAFKAYRTSINSKASTWLTDNIKIMTDYANMDLPVLTISQKKEFEKKICKSVSRHNYAIDCINLPLIPTKESFMLQKKVIKRNDTMPCRNEYSKFKDRPTLDDKPIKKIQKFTIKDVAVEKSRLLGSPIFFHLKMNDPDFTIKKFYKDFGSYSEYQNTIQTMTTNFSAHNQQWLEEK